MENSVRAKNVLNVHLHKSFMLNLDFGIVYLIFLPYSWHPDRIAAGWIPAGGPICFRLNRPI
jgi:hypothetical protein